jgi:hypothetical protein
VVAYICNLSIQAAEAGGSQVQGQPSLHIKSPCHCIYMLGLVTQHLSLCFEICKRKIIILIPQYFVERIKKYLKKEKIKINIYYMFTMDRHAGKLFPCIISFHSHKTGNNIILILQKRRLRSI